MKKSTFFIGAFSLVVFSGYNRQNENSKQNKNRLFYCITYIFAAKLLQKSEMRKDIVIELSYKGFG